MRENFSPSGEEGGFMFLFRKILTGVLGKLTTLAVEIARPE